MYNSFSLERLVVQLFMLSQVLYISTKLSFTKCKEMDLLTT